MKIIAIGGGEIKNHDTISIDKFIVNQTIKHKPKALFIPTASGDASGYCATFDEIYGRILGCRTDHLLLLRRKSDRELCRRKIEEADLIYVGGGNTLRMLKLWRRLGVDRLISDAGKKGTVLSGLSAGAICWHDWGHSDSQSFSGKNKWSYIKIRGLGLKKGIYCPHLDKEQRHKPFLEMVAKHRILGIASDENAAIFYERTRAVCVTSDIKARVHIYIPDSNNISVHSYQNGDEIELPTIG